MTNHAHRSSPLGLALLLALGLGVAPTAHATPGDDAHVSSAATAATTATPANPYGVPAVASRPAPTAPDVAPNPYGATPDNPFSPGPIEAAQAERRAPVVPADAAPANAAPATLALTAAERAPAAATAPPAAEPTPAPTVAPAPVEHDAAHEGEAVDAPMFAEEADDAPMFADTEPADMERLAAHAAAEPAPVTDDRAIAALDAVLSDDTADPISGVSHASSVAAPEGVPAREAVQDAIAEVAPSIRACVEGQRGRVVQVQSVFGSNGRVRAATVDARTAHFTPAQRSCMARAARGARVPAFERETFEVSFPVRL